jgi:membrane dipeptidase
VIPGEPLSRREFAKLAAVAAAGSRLPIPGTRDASASAESARWPGYDRAIVIDALATPTDFNVPDIFARPLRPDMVANARASGITACNVTVGGPSADPFVETVHNIAFCERELDAHPDVFIKIRSAADLRRAKEAKRLGLIYGFQDGTMLGEDPRRVDLFHDLGVRIIQFTYNRRNLLGDGCLEPANAGLSTLGRAMIGRMNELGILVDTSHCGRRTTLDAIAASTKPIAITHTGCAAINDAPRNKTDEQLRALADKGGVVGIYFMPYLRESGQQRADDVVRHLEHAIQICGEDHVGIGSDLSITPLDLTPEYRRRHAESVAERKRLGIGAPGEVPDVFNYVPELNAPRRLDLLADLLASRGHSSARIEKVIGGNWARLMGEVWG